MQKPLLLFIGLALLLSGCTSILVTPLVKNPAEIATTLITPTETALPETTPTPTPTLAPSPDVSKDRLAVTLEDVKNINHSSEISVTEEGILMGMPEGISDEEKLIVQEYCNAVQAKFFGSKIFYNKDEKTGNWLLFARMESNLFHRVVTIDDGTSRFTDYPMKFASSASGVGYRLVDSYNVITLQSESVDYIWENGIPQLVSDEVEILPYRDRYFTKYLIYDVDANAMDANLWAEVAGVYELIASAPTPVPSDVEEDLNPSYIQSTDYEYMGVRIKADLITDSSLNPLITKVTIPHAVFAEYIARMVFKAWWLAGPEKSSGMYSEENFTNFMILWSTAQKSGSVEDWEKLQLNNIFANDMNDGKGYVPTAYNLWPMYEGEKPLRAVGVNKISFVLVDTSDVKNIDQQSDINGTSYDIGYGTNLDGGNLLFYDGTDAYFSTPSYYLERVIDSGFAVFGNWLVDNKGKGRATSYAYNEFTGWLYERGLQAYP